MSKLEPTIEKGFLNGTKRAINEEERSAEFIISTFTKDRHGTVLNQDGWLLKNYEQNPIVGYQHDVYGDDLCGGPNPDTIIGTSKVWTEKDAEGNTMLIGKVYFEDEDTNPLAEKIWKKVKAGTLRTASVGFYPVGKGKWVEDGEDERTYHYQGQELLEWSIVNIPSNPDAVAREARSQRAKTLLNIKRRLSMSYEQIENMKVREVLELLEGRELPRPKNEQDTFKGLSLAARSRELESFNL